ncbi:RNA polymerase sigma-70 factor [Mucilaginibacter achroorhodeus]|uniref:RNA polymerase sigma-70 factor n=1 Tax=Mucilaginibacter achroorhodeus TaxID=2599294 RepID=A0A563U5X0_9SPHI|nr:RNA polymerase sigma-70 factor [Mucilaginibacter achroorhodeus]TWR26748.1 RNA polymerase sigma-70 factor [Mucilaginibacter achroorhodeus]
MQKDQDSLYDRLRSGDHKAFESLFKSHYRLMTLFANKMLNDMEIARDITDDAFTTLWEKRSELNVTGSLISYMYKMIQNRCLNHFKHQETKNLFLDYLQRHNLLNLQAENFERAYHDKEIGERIRSAVNELPTQCKMVFCMSRYEHFKYREIAEQLNISEKTVERHMTLAFAKLRQALKNDYSVWL